jgi:signal transduction histidine kinase
LPDGDRAAVERELAVVARAAALGELAGDVGHDIANPLFGVIGLVDLLLDDAAAGSEEEARLQLVQQTALELKTSVRELLAFARPAASEAREAALDAAARAAVALVRHGEGRSIAFEERYPDEPALVPCAPEALLQAVLHLLVPLRHSERIVLEVSGRELRVSPAPPDTLGTVVAARIAADAGGTLERGETWIRLVWNG